MQISVKVGDIDLDTILADFYDPDEDRAGQQTLGTLVAGKIAKAVTADDRWKTFRSEVADIRTAEVRAAISAQVDEALTAPIQPTDNYGEPRGPVTTMREMVAAEVTRFLTHPEPTGSGYNAPKRTALQVAVGEAVRDVLGREFDTEIRAAIKEEKEKVVAAVRAKGAELLAEAVKQGVGLR